MTRDDVCPECGDEYGIHDDKGCARITTTDTLASLRAVYAGGTQGPWSSTHIYFGEEVFNPPNAVWTGTEADAAKIVAQERMAAPGLALAEAVQASWWLYDHIDQHEIRVLRAALDAYMAAAAKAVAK